MYYNEETEYDGKQAEFEMREGIIGYCANCGVPIKENIHKRDGNCICDECYESMRTGTCDCCGAAILKGEDMLEADGWVFCEDCMDKERYECEICGCLVVEGDNCLIIETLFGDTMYICDDCGKRHRSRVARRESEARI